ncbi:hemA, partial [Symbiodinium sp. KB8]
ARSARLARELKVFRRQQAVKEKTVVVAKLDDVEEAEEIRRLQLEAAKLREDVLELEAVQQEEERRKREALFRSWDLDASGTLDEQELRIGLKEECKVEIDDDKAKRLLKALDDNGDGVLQNEDGEGAAEVECYSLRATYRRPYTN